MKRLKVFLSGMGRMGRELYALSTEARNWDLVGYTARTPKPQFNAAYYSAHDLHTTQLNADVIIDFSLPDNIRNVLNLARHTGLPLVSGTTGLTALDLDLLRDTSESVPVLWSSNMSVGVAVMKHAMRSFGVIPNFDFCIEEFHHRHKLDNPSGTALSLHAELQQILERETPAPLGMRGGGIFGIHSVHAMSEDETIEFKHTALNRSVFARGALRAAEWLAKQPNGFYTIEHALGLTELNAETSVRN